MNHETSENTEYTEFIYQLTAELAAATVKQQYGDELTAYIASLRHLNLPDEELSIRIANFSDQQTDDMIGDRFDRAQRRLTPLAQLIGPTLYVPKRLNQCEWVYGVEVVVMNFGRFFPGITTRDTEVAMAYVVQQHEKVCARPRWHADD